MREQVLQGYRDAAASLIERYEAISSAALFVPVAAFLPAVPARVLDLGAGTGRDAAWLAAQGHRVLAVEPVAAFRRAGQARHRVAGLGWMDDSLPGLPRTLELGRRFDLILLAAVWHHLAPADRAAAFAALAKLAAPGGRVVMSLRHGTGAPSRPVYPVRPAETQALAKACGFTKLHEATAASAQPGNRAAAVGWTWLVFEAGVPGG